LGQASRGGFRIAPGHVKSWHCGVSVLGAFRSHRAGLRRWSASTACPSGNLSSAAGASLVAVREWSAPRCQILVRFASFGEASGFVGGPRVVATHLALMCPALCPEWPSGCRCPWPGSRLMDPSPGSRASSRPVGACSAMWNHRPHKPPHSTLIVDAAGILVQLRRPVACLLSKIASGVAEMRGMVRFVRPVSPDDGTSAHPPGSRPGRRTPRPAGETTSLRSTPTPSRQSTSPRTARAPRHTIRPVENPRPERGWTGSGWPCAI